MIKSRNFTAATDDTKTAERWKFLESQGITDLLAHWMITNLSESQFDSMIATFARPASGPVEAARTALKTAAVTTACLRAVTAMSHLRGGKRSGLTERELQKCKAKGIDPAKYAATKAAMTGRR